MAVLAAERRLRLRTGSRRVYLERSVPFANVQTVRLTLLDPRSPHSAHIELVCAREVIECPPTAVPREEALLLAMTIGARLAKVYGEEYGLAAPRLNGAGMPDER
jgi:hypothetical protein